MEISFERGFRGAVVARLRGRLDALESPTFEGLLAQRMDDGDGRLVLDFSAVDYISSAGLRSLLALARRAEPEMGEWWFALSRGWCGRSLTWRDFRPFCP